MLIQDLSLLVVEDDDLQRRGAVAMLQALGATTILQAEDGASALARIASLGHPVDLVVCDLEMPGMDGVEFLRHAGQGRLVRFVIVASAREAPLLEAVEAMASAYGLTVLGTLQKPLTLPLLERLIAVGLSRLREPGQETFQEAIPDETYRTAMESWAFVPHLRPRIDLQEGRILGAEVRFHWPREGRPTVPPGPICQAMANLGLLLPYALHAMERLCDLQGRFTRAGMNLELGLHLPFASFLEPVLADRCLEVIQRAGGQASHLSLEAPPALLSSVDGRCLDTAARLRLKGIGLTIEGFDGGVSPESLRRIPLRAALIAPERLCGAWERAADHASLQRALAMARNLGLSVVADGVSSFEDWAFARRIGCQQVQGEFIARAMPIRDFLAWASCWKAPRL